VEIFTTLRKNYRNGLRLCLLIFSSSPFFGIEHTFFGGDILFRFIEHYHFLCDLFISIPDMFLGQLSFQAAAFLFPW